MDPTQEQRLAEHLHVNRDIFVTADNPSLGATHLAEHQIHLKPNAVLKHQRPYRLTPDKREILRHHLDELLNQGIISPVNEKKDLPVTSPIVIVSKRNNNKADLLPGTKQHSLGLFRFCVDFRHLNSQTRDFNYPLPDLQELSESFSERKAVFMSSIDLSSGFFQMPIAANSQRLTAFSSPFGSFLFKRLPMGLKTSPSSFSLLMNKVLKGLTFKQVLCYIDDILVVSDTFDQHLKDLEEVFSRLRQANLKLNPKKCLFARSKLTFLGHEISKDGMRPPPDRITAVQEYPPPKSLKELRRFMGLMNWFRKFIPNFSAKAHPLNQLTKQNVPFQWGESQQAAMDSLKGALLASPVLAFPRFDLEFRLAVDTSSKGIGYMLYQVWPEQEFPPGTSEKSRVKVVRFGSKSLTKYQSNYGPTKLELLGMVTSILDCAAYLRSRPFLVLCDHQALKPLLQNKLKGALYERWLAILQQFNFKIEYKPAGEMAVPDALSRCHPNPALDPPQSSPDETDAFFPYMQEPATGDIQLPGGTQLRDLIGHASTEEPQVNQIHSLVDPFSSSVDEYFVPAGPISCLEAADGGYDADTDEAPLGASQTRMLKPRKRTHTPTRGLGLQEASGFSNPDCYPVCALPDPPITSASCSSALESLSTMQEAGPAAPTPASTDATSSVEADVLDTRKRQIQNIDLFKRSDFSPSSIAALQRGDPQLMVLIQYLQDGTLPKSQKQSRKLLLEASDYVVVHDMLFHSRVPKSKRAKDLQHYQLVLPDVLHKQILEMYHDSPLAAHGGIKDTLDRIKEHYFFPEMHKVITDYVRSCHHCQVRKVTKVHTKSGIVAYPTPSAPFQVWQVDLYGPLPPSIEGSTYVFTAVDMFTKYLFVVPIANKDALTVADALFKLFTTFGTCSTLISDLGSEFIAKVIARTCEKMHVLQQFTPSMIHHCLQ